MEKIITTEQEIIKGVKIKEEVTLDLNEEQMEIVRGAAIQCDCTMNEVYIYLAQHKNLLKELYSENLIQLKEKLIEGIYEETFGQLGIEISEDDIYEKLESLCSELDIACAEDIVNYLITDFLGIKEQQDGTFEDRIRVMKEYRKLLANRLE